MNIIKISPTDDPSKISQIDLKNSLILCVTENNNTIEIIDKTLYLKTPSDISFNGLKILSNNYTIINYSPNVRWCYPNDINLIFREANNVREKSYFSNIYVNQILNIKNEKNTLSSQSFNIYIDRNRSKELGKIRKNEYMLEVDIMYKMFAEVVIENLYVIKNNYCFQEFEQHFSI